MKTGFMAEDIEKRLIFNMLHEFLSYSLQNSSSDLLISLI